MRISVLILGLAGCATAVSAPAPHPQGRTARIAAECRLLEVAHAETLARGLDAPSDILVGCPGHETARDTMPLKAQSAALRRANAAVLPPDVVANGPQAARLYRRMISRGVPEAVAAAVSQGALLRDAARS